MKIVILKTFPSCSLNISQWWNEGYYKIFTFLQKQKLNEKINKKNKNEFALIWTLYVYE